METKTKRTIKRNNFNNRVYRIVREILVGKVMTYGQIAKKLGRPEAAQAVGNALHKNPKPKKIPCYRVVNYLGRIAESYAFGGEVVQRKQLMAEGIKFKDENHVDLRYINIT